MNKLKFFVNRLKNMKFSAMFKTARIVSNKTKRLYLIVLADIIYCGLRYQAGYNDYLEFEFYLLNKAQRKTYLTAGINNSIIKKYNDKTYWHIFDDKVEFNNKFKEYLKREWLDLRETSFEQFLEFIKQHKKIIVKPIDDCGGKGIETFDFKNNMDVSDIYDSLLENKQFLIEEFVSQHEDMNLLYKDSVNTLRMFTIYTDKAYFLEGVLKFGNGGAVDNFSSGGMYTFVDEQGVAIAPAIDKGDNIYEKHPITGREIVGFQVPLFKEAVKLVCDAACLVPEVGYVGWDVAITKSGPIIIEGNCYPGVFQMKPRFSKTKIGLIPKYSKYMEILR